MKKPKIVSYENRVITIALNGQLHSYFVGRPQPLSPADAAILRNTMDRGMLKAMFEVYGPRRGVLSWLSNLWRRRGVIPYPYEAIADYVEKVGVEIDVGKAKALVIHRSLVDKIRKGDIA